MSDSGLANLELIDDLKADSVGIGEEGGVVVVVVLWIEARIGGFDSPDTKLSSNQVNGDAVGHAEAEMV